VNVATHADGAGFSSYLPIVMGCGIAETGPALDLDRCIFPTIASPRARGTRSRSPASGGSVRQNAAHWRLPATGRSRSSRWAGCSAHQHDL